MKLFLAGIRKLYRRTATIVAIALTVGLVAGYMMLIGVTVPQLKAQSPSQVDEILRLLQFPQAYDVVLEFLLGFGGLVIVIFGAAVGGTEWSWGTLKVAVARGESRARYVLLTFASIAGIVVVLSLVTFVFGVGGAIVGNKIAGLDATGLNDSAALSALPAKIVRVMIGLVEFAAIGYSIATIARSQMAGVGASIGAYLTTSFGALALPDVLKWFPFNVANFASDLHLGEATSGAPAQHTVDPNVALVAVIAWLVGSLAVASIFTERAEISG